MKRLRRAIERLVQRHDPRRDYARARLVQRRSDRLIRENQAILEDINRMEQEIVRVLRR